MRNEEATNTTDAAVIVQQRCAKHHELKTVNAGM